MGTPLVVTVNEPGCPTVNVLDGLDMIAVPPIWSSSITGSACLPDENSPRSPLESASQYRTPMPSPLGIDATNEFRSRSHASCPAALTV